MWSHTPDIAVLERWIQRIESLMLLLCAAYARLCLKAIKNKVIAIITLQRTQTQDKHRSQVSGSCGFLHQTSFRTVNQKMSLSFTQTEMFCHGRWLKARTLGASCRRQCPEMPDSLCPHVVVKIRMLPSPYPQGPYTCMLSHQGVALFEKD